MKLILTIGVAGLLAACGGATSEAPTPATDETQTTTNTTQDDSTAAPQPTSNPDEAAGS